MSPPFPRWEGGIYLDWCIIIPLNVALRIYRSLTWYWQPLQTDDLKQSAAKTRLKLWSEMRKYINTDLLIIHIICSPWFQICKPLNNISKNRHFYKNIIYKKSNAVCYEMRQFLHALALCFGIMASYILQKRWQVFLALAGQANQPQTSDLNLRNSHVFFSKKEHSSFNRYLFRMTLTRNPSAWWAPA